jgi:hypothetical protein
VNGGVNSRPRAAGGYQLLPGIFIRSAPMMAIAFVFFALSIAYCYACDRL